MLFLALSDASNVISLAAPRFLEILRGDLPKWFGAWESRRFTPDGTLISAKLGRRLEP